MSGDHPWYDWFRVLVIFLVGLGIVMILVRIVIKWAQKDEPPPPLMPTPEPEQPKAWTDQIAPAPEPPVQFNPPKITQKKKK